MAALNQLEVDMASEFLSVSPVDDIETFLRVDWLKAQEVWLVSFLCVGQSHAKEGKEVYAVSSYGLHRETSYSSYWEIS